MGALMRLYISFGAMLACLLLDYFLKMDLTHFIIMYMLFYIILQNEDLHG